MKNFMTYMIAVFFFISSAGPAHAYLDPGSGSMVVQLLLGALAGVAVFFKFFWRKLFGFFGFGRAGKKDSNQDVSEHNTSDR